MEIISKNTGLSYKDVRKIMNRLFSIDRKFRRGPRPKWGMYADSDKIRALFPLPRFRAVRRIGRKIKQRRIFQTRVRKDTTPIYDTSLIMTSKNGTVTFTIETQPESSSRILAALSNVLGISKEE